MIKIIPYTTNNLDKEFVKNLNPLSLAFIGDSVQTLYVRTKYLLRSGEKAGALHLKTANEVKAASQAKEADILLPLFTEEETDIYHRARNSKGGTPSKNASTHDYKKASGLEAVIGYLYLTGQTERLEFIFKETEILFKD